MSTISFKELRFEKQEEKVRIYFHNLFYFELDKAFLDNIGEYQLTPNEIIFKDVNEKRASSRFNLLLDKGLNNLRSRLTNKRVIYIHQNSGIPLIGTNYFGIIDRGTNIIEIKPMNGCNLDCIYCSVDEGFSSRRPTDFIVQRDYLVNELRNLIEFKNTKNIHANIAGQGETLMYPEIIELVGDISNIRNISIVSLITNGTMLTARLIDELVHAGLTRLNVSLNSLDSSVATKIANRVYDVKRVVEMVRYASKKLEVLLVPVLIPTINDNDISDIIQLYKEIKNDGGNVRIGIQNFLNYRFGRNPINQISWDDFYNKLSALERIHDVNLRYSEDILFQTKELTKPFKKGDIIKASVVCDGRLKNERLAVANERLISIPNCFKDGTVNLKIVRSKHNIFVGVLR